MYCFHALVCAESAFRPRPGSVASQWQYATHEDMQSLRSIPMYLCEVANGMPETKILSQF
jgi:hypothetical protein